VCALTGVVTATQLRGASHPGGVQADLVQFKRNLLHQARQSQLDRAWAAPGGAAFSLLDWADWVGKASTRLAEQANLDNGD
jgi:hypothetical protein